MGLSDAGYRRNTRAAFCLRGRSTKLRIRKRFGLTAIESGGYCQGRIKKIVVKFLTLPQTGQLTKILLQPEIPRLSLLYC